MASSYFLFLKQLEAKLNKKQLEAEEPSNLKQFYDVLWLQKLDAKQLEAEKAT